MSEPIDVIDLTVDSPANNILRQRTRNNENANIPNTTTRSRKSTKNRGQSRRREDSVILVAPDTVGNSTENESMDPVEIIDLDETVQSDYNGVCYTSDSDKGKLVVLTCPICYEELCPTRKPMSTRCGHIFCSHCLAQAIRTAKRCPTCQRSMKLQSCTRLYF